MKKRLLSILLTVLMIVSLLPVSALAANIVKSGTCGAEGEGSNLTWTLDSDGVLTISGSGGMHDYGPSVPPWHGIRIMVKSAVIADGVTSIGRSAFDDCRSLTSVTIPDSVTSIGEYAFDGCTSLTSVTIPDSVTSIGGYAFSYCTSLTGIWVAEGNSHYSSDASGVLFNKDKTTLVQCPGTFAAYTIPDSVTRIGDRAFSHCTSLTSVTIPDSVTSIGEQAFQGCESLTSVTIPDSVTSIGERAFYNCTSLTSVAIPDSVMSIGERAFYYCTSLTSVTIPDSVMNIGDGAFASCTSLTGIWVTEGNNDYSSDASGVLFNKDKTTLVQCPGAFSGSYAIPNSVTSIVGYAFEGCASLTSVTIPDGVTSIGDSAFYYCTSLTSVTIPDGVTSIGGLAFCYCTSLTSVTIPDSVTSIGLATFYNCRSLTSVTIPDSVTIIGGSAFSDCDNLTDVYYTGTEIAWKKIKISDYNDALKNATIHYFSEWTREKEPTCTEPGSETSVCLEAGCGKTFTREIPALGHSWDEGKVTKEPTETETGIKTYTCTRCGETKTETIPATGSVDVTQMFTDVKKGWAYPGIQYCVTNGLMAGKGDGKFDPSGMTTRAEFVQMLYSLHGKPEVSGALPFTDLPEVWYRDAILWAYQTGVTSGTSDTTFSPYATVTRAQVATFLMKYAKTVCNVKPTWTPADLSKYPDVNNVPGWALGAMQDAVALGLINGNKASDGTVYLDPNGNAPREQVATILMQFCKNVKK